MFWRLDGTCDDNSDGDNVVTTLGSMLGDIVGTKFGVVEGIIEDTNDGSCEVIIDGSIVGTLLGSDKGP